MISLTESSFVKKALSQQQRLDGRSLNEMRQLHFEFGNDRGHVIVHLGETK
jgi:exosome complex RNA-binding protein Rrp42 (RNase PH superfamily)